MYPEPYPTLGQRGRPRPGHRPQRTCIACRETRAKGELTRLVCSAGGEVSLDPRGRLPGRGAYLCPRRECWEIGLKGNRLEHVLHGPVSGESRQRLLAYGQTLPRRQ